MAESPSSHGASAGMAADGHPGASDKIEAHVWITCGVVIVGMIMSILDTTIVNVALDTLGRDLHSPISQVQWVVTGYLLALAAVMPATGWMARRYGAKRVYLVSLLLFTLGSVACGLSNSLVALVVFRILQGIGGGMIMPVAQMIMAEVAGPKRMGRVMGIVVMPAMLAPILGPVVGGLILQNLHWSWIFFVNVPIGIVAAILGWRMLPDSGLGAALFGAMILVPLYYQQVRGESVIVTGLLVGPQGLGMLLVAPWIARMTERFGGGRVAFVGVSVLTLSSLPLAFIGADTSIV